MRGASRHATTGTLAHSSLADIRVAAGKLRVLLLDEGVADLRVGCVGLEGADHPRPDLGVAARV